MERVSHKHYSNEGNKLVLEAIPKKPLTILDLGCGAGSNARVCVERGHTVDGITLSELEASVSRSICRDVVVCDLEQGLPDVVLSRRYDFCICSHVLEHLRWPKELLIQVRSVLPASGPRMVVALPNIMYFKSRYALFRGRFDYVESGIMDASHFRWFTFQTGIQLLEEAGYSVLSAKAEGNFPLSMVRRFLPSGMTRPLDASAVKWFPGLFGLQLVYVA